jgi:hypothetical protein
MADKTLKVTLNATDNASAVFKKAGDSAKKLGDELNNAGKGAQTFRQRFEEAARSVEDSNRQYDASNKIMRDVGISAGIMVAGMGLASQSFRDQQIALDTLSRTYGDSADEMERFAQQIQETTNFSNDAALEAANIAGTLARNYGFTAQEIQNVLQISADLAATSGLSLADTTQRVTAALRGEAEGAEVLGLTLNQAAIDSQNLTLTMSNQEAGHFRLNALIEQSGFAQGAAAQQADSFYGSLANVRDGLQDLNQRLGGALGPFGDLGAFAADNAVQFAAMGLAIGQISSTVGTLNSVATAMTGVNVASKAMSLAFGPVGIAAAAGLAAVAIYELWHNAEGMVPAIQKAEEHLGDLEQTVRELYAMGSTLGSLGERATEGIFPDLSADIAEIEDLQDKIAGTNAVIGQMSGADLEKANADLETWSFRLMEIADKYGILDASMLEATITQQDVIDGMDDLNAILANTGAGAAQAQEETAELFDQYERGEISAETLLSDLDLIANSFDAYNANATKAAEGTAQLTEAQQQYNMALAVANQTLEQYQQNQQIGGQNLAGEHEEMAAAIEKENAARDEANRAMQEYLDAEQQIAGASFEADTATKTLSESTTDYITAIYQANVALNPYNEALARQAAEAKLLADAQAEYTATFEQMQSVATQATDTLDSVFRAIVGNTDAIASQSQAVADWAEELIGAEGTWAQIDDLLIAGAITLDEYTAAQGAYNQIATANASIQEDVLSIQAQLAPVVATATEALAAQMDEIANGSTDAQLFALGMMDATTSAQALALAQGYLENQEVFGPMIQQAAELNPMLAQILEEMGLISYNPATGEVRLLGVDESQSELALLTDAMDQLNQTVATLIAILQDDASGPIGDVQNLLDGLDGDTATVFTNLIDNASSGIGAIAAQLYALDGFTATTYVQTLQTGLTGIFRHGGVAGYAHGGVIAELAEGNRTELLHFATGGVLPISQNGIYDIPVGTYVSPHNAVGDTGNHPSIVVNISGPFNNTDEAAMDRWAQQRLIPAFRGVLQDTRRGQVS